MAPALAHPLQSALQLQPTPERPMISQSRLTTISKLLVGALALASSATAQSASSVAEFERPIGWAYGAEDRAFEASTRDRHGNRVILNGLIEGGTTLGQGLSTGWGETEGLRGMLGGGLAVGNQLNVVTNGSNNTIIIDSTQINNGDQSVVLGGK